MQILQLSTALPDDEYSTDKLMETFPCILSEGVRQNVLNLGVSKRYLVKQDLAKKSEVLMSETGLSDLCTEACEAAIQKASLSVKDIRYLVAAYDVNPFLSPGLSQLLIPRLGLNPYIKYTNIQGIASTAFINALQVAEGSLALHPEDNILLCVSGVSSYWFHNQVRGLKNVTDIGRISSMKRETERYLELRKWVAAMEFFLFGDGAAAAIVTKNGEGLTVNRTAEITNIEEKDYSAGYARLSILNEPFKFGFHSYLDKEIPRLGVKYTDLVLKKMLGHEVRTIIKTAKRWAVHTGSKKILDALAEQLGIDRGKLEESHQVLSECGNLSGASLPFILERIVSGSRVRKGEIILMLGYGWGFSAAASLLEYTRRQQ